MKEHFEKVDADKDGKIDREEGRRAMMAAMKKVLSPISETRTTLRASTNP